MGRLLCVPLWSLDLSLAQGIRQKKKGRSEWSGPALDFRRDLKAQLQRQLHRAAAARSDDRVSSSHIRCGTTAAKRLHRRVIQAKAVLTAIWISKVRMATNVQDF